MRGYTLSLRTGYPIDIVSPVHAGIYPHLADSGHRSCGFPRSCGDIPPCIPTETSLHGFPPFMRGYTLSIQIYTVGLKVSPVHAGIYLFMGFFVNPLIGFPRSCGDIPVAIHNSDGGKKFPPFMRGYTCHQRRLRLYESVSPVHAGIYPIRAIRPHCATGFPRSCGDIPNIALKLPV